MLDATRFQTLWQCLGSYDDSSVLFTQLLNAYLQPHRVYHTVSHLEACLQQLDLAQKEAERPAEVEVALWFHDAVYIPKAVDNEAQSSLWATQSMQQPGVSPVAIGRIATMITATKHDHAPETRDCELLLDIDLSILGQTPEQFATYEHCIRSEYSWLPEQQYRTGRVNILKSLLQRSTIYYTPFFQERLETQARHNLEQSIAKLCGQRR